MSEEEAMSHSIWLDCDTGHDDAYAILLAAHHPTARLLGVSTVHGNAPLDQTTRNTCAILEALGCSSIPVVRGRDRPLTRPPTFAPKFHGESGLGGVTLLPEPSSYKLQDLPTGVAEIRARLIVEPQDSVWIVATGPLTNIAALLMEHPDVVPVIRGISIMGGAIGEGFTRAPSHRLDGPGNWTPWAEFNIFCDPEAARFVFQCRGLSSKPKHKATLDLTHQCRTNAAVLQQLFGRHEPLSRFREMMRQVVTYFAESYDAQVEGMQDGPPLHDPLAVFAVLDEGDLSNEEREQWEVDVTVEGEQAGRTRLRRADGTGVGVNVARTVDVEKFWAMVDECLSRAERMSPLIK